MEVVIARFNEDVSWSRHFDNVIVYNKGQQLEDNEQQISRTQQVQLPNVGRETQTYLHHIVTRYDNLEDVTLFTQGWPWDHCYETDMQNAHETYRFRLLSKELLTETFAEPEYHPGLGGMLEFVYKTLFVGLPPKYITFGPGAIFAATANAIRRRSKRFYEVAHYIAWEVEEAGYAFERLWPIIFSQQVDCFTE
jgi:hypothetical protein